MRVLFAASEVYPLLKTGGLADVAAALPGELIRQGVDVRILMPGYPEAMAMATHKRKIADLGLELGAGPAQLIAARLPETEKGQKGPTVWFLDCPSLYGQGGGPYVDAQGQDWPDSPLRFGLLSFTAARLCVDPGLTGWAPDLLHGHDWQAGLAPAYLKAWSAKPTPTVFTIHNIAYQGTFDPSWVERLGLPRSMFAMNGLEYYGGLGFLKAGCFYSDRLTTVSPTYAQEIQTPAQGCGLEGLLAWRAKDLTGIVNGVDYGVWNPAKDPHLGYKFKPGDAQGKRRNKTVLQREMGLALLPDAPLLCMISRLNDHKGTDMVIEALPGLLDQGVQFAALGTGEFRFEEALRELSRRYPQQAQAHIGYSEALAHRILAGSDILLMPSRSEPCGLTHLYGYRYGTVPVVGKVGGLADTVSDLSLENLVKGTGSGFVAQRPDTAALNEAIGRALVIYARRPSWDGVIERMAGLDFGWRRSALGYLDLYRSLVTS
jgi:starch synthase